MNTSPPPETVRAYLGALQRALKGCSHGLIADALADCEEHLNNEMAQNPERSEAEILAAVVETYGTPEEIAEEYRDMEAAIQGPFPKTEQAGGDSYGFFGIIRDPRAYGALLYMLLSLVTGIVYFTFVVTGVSLTLGLFITLIGIPLGLLVIGMGRVFAHVEGRIVEGLLGVRMPRRLPPATQADETIMARIKDALVDTRTWSSLLYLLLMLPLGTAYFVIATVGLSCSLGITASALWVLITGDASHIHVDSAPWAYFLTHKAPGLVILTLIGMLLFFVVLHVAKGIGWLHGRIAELLLVRL